MNHKLFLSYNSSDRVSVVAVQKLLTARGIATFLDRDQLVPGQPWPQALEEALRSVCAVAVFLGPELGGWQKRETYFALDRQVAEEKQGRRFPVIPVLLRGADLSTSFLFTNTWIDLRAPAEGTIPVETLDAFERAITAEAVLSAPDHAIEVCPYRGLEAFREQDAAFFAGRLKFSLRLLHFTLGKNLVAVVGPSGSGKSSVVCAGLVPLLRRQLPPATTWDVVIFTPGVSPFHRLASALIPLLEPDHGEVDRLVEGQKLGAALAEGGIKLDSLIARVIERSNGTGHLLLVADQFEELFTQTREAQRRPFTAMLLDALGNAPFTLILTLRADFYNQIIILDRDLSDRLAEGQVNIGAFTRDELRETITVPAKLVGLEFEAGLIDRILDEVGSEPGNLPLLEYALTGLWSSREGHTLTNTCYNQIAGVTGALAMRAEAEFSKFTPEEQSAARRLFSRLVRVARPDEGAEDTRQRLELEPFDAVTNKVAQALSSPNVRLLVMDRATDRTKEQNRETSASDKLEFETVATVEVAHEAVIRNWDRLRHWLNEDREFLLWRQRTEIQIDAWQRHESDDSYLLRGVSLDEAERWLIGHQQDLALGEKNFIECSLQLRKRELAENEQRRQTEIEVEKKHAVANLLGGVSHDVNNALRHVLPLVQQILSDIQSNRLQVDTLLQDLQQIEQSIQTCRRIFGEMLALSRGASQRSAQGNVRRALDSTLAVLRDGLERHRIQVDVQLGDVVPNIQAGQGDLEQLFLNLATNAKDAMPTGGVLSIKTESSVDHVEILIHDTGCGIAPEAMLRIGEPFFTTKRDGTGLGLSICRSIISNVGGRLEVESQAGVGTQIRVLLPIVPTENAQPVAALAETGHAVSLPATVPAATRDSGTPESSATGAEMVDTAVFCPSHVARDSVFLVQVFLYSPKAAEQVYMQAHEADETAHRRGTYSLPLDLPLGTRVDLHLEIPGLTVAEPDATLVWRGNPSGAQFEVAVAADAAGAQAIGRVRIAVAGVPAGTLRFQVALNAAGTSPGAVKARNLRARRYRRAFVSYSSQDRAEVLRRVQAFRIAGLSVFQDILDLDAGERWQQALYHEIDNCDVFLLFWSHAAAASEWVGKEIEYALARKGGIEDRPPDIQPVPIEGPPIVPPPASLSGLHFNDALLAQIRAADPA